MNYSDILQDISVDLSSMVKKHLKNIKKLDSKQQKQFGNLFGDMKQGIDDLSEGTNESVVNEGTDIYLNKRIQITKFAGQNGKMVQINAPKYQTAGDHIVMSKDEFIRMLKNSPKILNQLKESNESVNEAKIAFVNDKLVGDRIQKSGLLPLLGDNNVSLNPNKVKFTRELRDTLVKLYKKYSSLTVK
jgi:hypothetical protein